MSAAPIFYVTPRCGYADSPASANSITLYASANNVVEVIAGATSPGSLIERVIVEQSAKGLTTANNLVRFFHFDGTGYNFIAEGNMGAAVTSDADTASPRITVPELVGYKLPSATDKIFVGFSVAGTGANIFRVTIQVADA